jgi:hypothetical protein
MARADKRVQEDLKVYMGLMTEVNVRFSAIQKILDNKSGLPPRIVQESSFLQLRMLCELIALGCLVAHGDIPEINSMRQKHEADWIVNRLEALHPDFYPVPVSIRMIDGELHGEDKTDVRYLTKAALVELYTRRCGPNLHKGSLKKLLKHRSPVQNHFPDIVDGFDRISALLATHRMMLVDGTMWCCTLGGRENDWKVEIMALAAEGDTSRP